MHFTKYAHSHTDTYIKTNTLTHKLKSTLTIEEMLPSNKSVQHISTNVNDVGGGVCNNGEPL